MKKLSFEQMECIEGGFAVDCQSLSQIMIFLMAGTANMQAQAGIYEDMLSTGEITCLPGTQPN